MKTCTKLLSALWLCALFCVAAPVEAATYAYRNDVFAYDTPSAGASSVTWHASGAAPGCTGFPNGDDDWADITFPAGFSFTFGGVNYLSVRVYSNGILAFPTDVSGFHRDYTPQALPITTAAGSAPAGCPNAVPVNLMIAYWVDIIAGSTAPGAAVKYEQLTDTTTGQKRFAITWNNVALYGNTATRYSFQIVLYESLPLVNGNFKFQYTTGSTTGTGATVGVQLTTTDYTQYAYNQNFIDTTVGTTILWYPANQLAGKAAEYRFDEGAWIGTAGEIKDTSGNISDASRLGAVTNIAGGKLCRGGSFTNNTLNTTIDAVATPIVPANQGAVSFWYKSTAAWNSADTMLFDATTVAARPFFLMKRSTGALRFAVTDSAGTVRTAETSTGYTYAANTWHHVAASWNIKPGTNQTVLQILLDGVLVNTLTTTPFRTTTSGAIASFSSLYIGDNRSSGITPSTGSPNGANGVIDEVYIYPIDINASQAAADMALTRPTCGTLDHFHIVHGGELVNCGGPVANITVEAHDATHGLFSLAGTTMQMATSTAHGTWSSVTTINPVNNTGGGNGNYTFSNESSIVLGLANTFVESLNINLSAGTVTELSGAASSCVSQDYTFGTTCDANLNFAQAGFRFVDSAGNPVGNQVSGVTSGVYFLQAVKNTCTAPGACTGVCTSVFPSGSAVSIGLGMECKNPGSCQAGQQTTVATTTPAVSAAVALNNAGAISGTIGTYTTRSVTFNTIAPDPTPSVPFTFNYSDAGQVALWARYPATGTASVYGSSAPVVVKPHHFDISGIACTTVGPTTCAPANASGNNPAAVNSAGAAFIQAGRPFKATVTAMNGAGSPAATPNFGQEKNGVDGIEITSFNHLPALGGAAAISSSVLSPLTPAINPFSGGSVTVSNLSWGEVGVLQLRATLANANGYLGSDTINGKNSVTSTCAAPGSCTGSSGNPYVGRFIPDHFDTAVVQGCNAGGFSYSAQPFAVTVTAKNAAAIPATTANYYFDGIDAAKRYSKAVTLSAWDSLGTSANPGPGALSNSAVAAASFGTTGAPLIPGVAATPTPPTLAASPIYAFTSPPKPATTVRLRARDTDSCDGTGLLCSAPGVEGLTAVRSGRARLLPAYGSELLDLPMTFRTEFWDGRGTPATTDDGWAMNVSDVCTGDVSLGAANAVSVALAPAALACVWDVAAPVGGLSTAGCAAAGAAARRFREGATPGVGFAGDFNLWLHPSGAGTVLVTPTVPAWLGAVTPARATFGVFKNPLIFRRENY